MKSQVQSQQMALVTKVYRCGIKSHILLIFRKLPLTKFWYRITGIANCLKRLPKTLPFSYYIFVLAQVLPILQSKAHIVPGMVCEPLI